MPEADYHRHDISDRVWKLLKPHLSGQRGQWGGIAKDNRKFINAVFFILRTGSTWRDLSPDFSSPKIYALAEKGTWKKILDILIDATHIKVHPDACGAVGGNQDMDSTPKSTWQ